ncbi:MAG: DUF697 domain-containing protein, partial [Hyphomicrobiales bacterium]|nr:DUF697 domain-containing protein [Hyphomicrobiales bacterium]
ISPRALVDMLFVFAAAIRLVRQLAKLYGGRPGALGMIALMRHAISHLAITGGMAASDSMIQQVLGHGIAAKLSQRLGEGILNGRCCILVPANSPASSRSANVSPKPKLNRARIVERRITERRITCPPSS